MKNKTKEIISLSFIVLLFGGATFFWLVSGISGLLEVSRADKVDSISDTSFDAGSYITTDNYYVIGEVLEVNHRVNTFFKVGTDHYILLSFNNSDNLFVVIASDKDCEKILNNENISITGRLISPDSKVQNQINQFLNEELPEEYLDNISPLYLNTQVKVNSLIKLVSGLITACLIIYIALLSIYTSKAKSESAEENYTIHTEKKPKLFYSKFSVALLLILLCALIVLMFCKSYVLFGTNGVYVPSNI